MSWYSGTVTVTAADIKAGRELKRKDPEYQGHQCPVAIALNRRFRCSGSYVGRDYMRVGLERISTPQRVKAFILAFDCDRAVRSFKFEFGAPHD